MNRHNPCLLLDRELMVIAVYSRFKISEFRLSKEKETNNSVSELLHSPQYNSPRLSLDLKALVL